MKLVIYDCEIINCIPSNNLDTDKYYACEGWHDFQNMGISVIGFAHNFDLFDNQKINFFNVLSVDFILDKICKNYKNPKLNFESFILIYYRLKYFLDLIDKSDYFIGFNNHSFHDNLISSNHINLPTEKSIDLLTDIREASGQPRSYTPGITPGGYSLDAIAKANLNYGKSGSGALAPQLWQDGKYDDVISYCKDDINLTIQIAKLFYSDQLIDPTNGEVLICPESSPLKGYIF